MNMWTEIHEFNWILNWMWFAVFSLLLVYRYLTWNHKYWEERKVPGPKPLPFFGTYLTHFFTPLQEIESYRFEKYGKIYGIFDGTEPGLILGDPILIKQMLVKDFHTFTNRRPVKTTHPVMSKFLSSLEDHNWKRIRTITTPTFTSRKLKVMFEHMRDATVTMMATLELLEANGREVDLKQIYSDYTMDIIARSAFSTRADPLFVKNARKLFTFPFWRKFLDYTLPMSILEPFKFTLLPPDAMHFFKLLTLQIIREKNTDHINYSDFLGHLLFAKICEPNVSEPEPKIQTDIHKDAKYTQLKLTEEEIVSQSVLFFLAAFETPSQLLTYATYCLALNPVIQETLYHEIVEAVEENNGKIDYHILPQLVYLDAVVSETLRLFNPTLRTERRAKVDYKLGDTDIVIPKGMMVGIPIWALHHSQEYFPEPETFDPNRFLPQNKEKISPYSFLPFGAGPRNCIGSRFALLETKLALVETLIKYRFFRSKRTQVPLSFFPCGRPILCSGDVFVGIKKRDQSEQQKFI